MAKSSVIQGILLILFRPYRVTLGNAQALYHKNSKSSVTEPNKRQMKTAKDVNHSKLVIQSEFVLWNSTMMINSNDLLIKQGRVSEMLIFNGVKSDSSWLTD